METRDVVIVGGGPAGLAAAVELYKKGIRNVLIVEREKTMGGILRQCIHDGFGLTRFGETLSGPEYAQKFIDEVMELKIPYVTDTTVLSVSPDKVVTLASSNGLKKIQAKAVILTMGCRERTRGALGIPGERPTGVFTAGVAQAYINLYNRMVGKEVVILGSGDIGMIMARRLTLEGAHVQAVFEIQPIPSGLPRNIEQCLNDYGIPLYLSHTITDIHGNERVTGVTVAQVDEHMKPIPGTEKEYNCDTVILSVGLIPENELSKAVGVELSPVTNGPTVNESLETSIPGVFACGNVLHVHDLVDYVSEEAQQAGKHAAAYVQGAAAAQGREIPLKPQGAARYTVPVSLCPQRMGEQLVVRFRVGRNIRGGVVKVFAGDKLLYQRKRPVMAPGEMEQVIFKREWLTGAEQEIRVVAEEEEAQ